MQDQLGDGAARGGGLLRAVSGKAVGEVEVGQLRVRADDGVVVERVEVVEAGPGIDDLDALEGRNARRQLRPDLAVEEGVVDVVEVLGGRLAALVGRQAAQEQPALRAEPDAGRIDGQRRALQRVGSLAAVDDVDVALARLDRQPQAGQRRQLSRPGTGRIDSAPQAMRPPLASRTASTRAAASMPVTSS